MSEANPDASSASLRRVLVVHYTHSVQAQRVTGATADVLRDRGCDVTQASIELTDPKYSKNLKVLPFRHRVLGTLPLLWPQTLRRTGQIPPTDLKPDFQIEASAFAHRLADTLTARDAA